MALLTVSKPGVGNACSPTAALSVEAPPCRRTDVSTAWKRYWPNNGILTIGESLFWDRNIGNRVGKSLRFCKSALSSTTFSALAARSSVRTLAVFFTATLLITDMSSNKVAMSSNNAKKLLPALVSTPEPNLPGRRAKYKVQGRDQALFLQYRYKKRNPTTEP